MSTTSGDHDPHDTVLARVTALLAVVVVLVIALQGCAGTDPVPGATDSPGAPSGPRSPVSATPSATASPSPAPYRLPPFRPAGHGDWTTRIPVDVRVDTHLPADGGDFERAHLGVRMEFCGEQAFGSSGVLDRRVASASGPEYGEARDLRLFADDRAAHRFVRAVHAAVAACPDEETDGTTWRNEVRLSGLDADESFTAVQAHFAVDGLPVLGGNFWEVARVGNAVLLTAIGGEYDAATTLDHGLREHAREVSPIVASMCVFAAVACG